MLTLQGMRALIVVTIALLGCGQAYVEAPACAAADGGAGGVAGAGGGTVCELTRAVGAWAVCNVYTPTGGNALCHPTPELDGDCVPAHCAAPISVGAVEECVYIPSALEPVWCCPP